VYTRFMDGLLTLIKRNICAIAMIVVVSAAANSLQILQWSIPLDLELGAVLAMVILFGWWAFPGLLLASYFTTSIFLGDDNPHAELLLIVTILKTMTPYMALSILKMMRLDNFFADSRISYRHLAFLILLTILINIIAMYFTTLGRELSGGFDLASHLSRHISGAVLGCVAFFTIFIAMHKAYVVNHPHKKLMK